MPTARLFFSLLLLVSTLALGQQEPDTAVDSTYVSVVGHGVVYGEPDVATIRLGATSESADVREAVSRLDETIARVLEALLQVGVAENDIRTTSYNLWREERYPPERPAAEPGETEAREVIYHGQHMLTVQVDGAEGSGEVLAAAIEAGANAVGGISFGFSEPQELERRAREAAVRDARERALELAVAAGVTLGQPLAIEELGNSERRSPMFERSAAVMSDSPIATGELSVEVRVAIRFRLDTP